VFGRSFLTPFVTPFVFSSKNQRRIAGGLPLFSEQTKVQSEDTELMMAGSVVTVLPVLLLFLALQRHYLQGLLPAV